MKKKYLVMTILFIAVGFAAVATTLFLNGTIKIGGNTEDFDIYFSKVEVDGTEDNSLIVDDQNIEFAYEFKSVGDKKTIEYFITNGSSNYDAKVSVNCVEGNDYLTVTNNWVDNTVIESKTTDSGTVEVELVKAYEGSGLDYDVQCTITVNAVERESLGTGDADPKVNQGINLYNMIAENASNEIINFSVHSGTSGTNGIYTTTATEGNVPVYYYRGSKDQVNNNIIFNNMCWKIIRTTATGGVKLIYNGIPTDGKCEATGANTQIGTSAFNPAYNDNAYVGYMYGTPGSNSYAATHANTNNSTIKTYIDNWYANNFDAETTAKLEDTIFCNDRSTKAYDANTIGGTYYSSFGALGYGTNATFYGAAHRASYYSINPNPSLVCPQANDKFTVSSAKGNGVLTNPVGLITLDEVVLAGYNTYYSNTSDYINTTNFLHTGQNYWTFSPVAMDANGDVRVGSVDGTGYVDDYYVNYAGGVRPVVSLADGTLVEPSGEGTSTNPYVVK